MLTACSTTSTAPTSDFCLIADPPPLTQEALEAIKSDEALKEWVANHIVAGKELDCGW